VKIFIAPSILNDSFAGLKKQVLLSFKVSIEKSAVILMG
jgi:hypothetical protein